MKYIKFLILTIFIFPQLAMTCSSFGNGGDGCAEKVLGVQTVAGKFIEITTTGTNWYQGHVCTGSTVVRFGGTDLEKQAALSIAMAAIEESQAINFSTPF